jgi:hypothetical protein
MARAYSTNSGEEERVNVISGKKERKRPQGGPRRR